jgi:predicted nucleotidyltransferase
VDINAPILQQIKNSVLATDPDAVLILYGSCARGDNGPDSDIDILVLLDKDKITYDDRKRIGHPLYDIQLEMETLISPRIFSRNQWETKYKITPLYKNITSEGRLL